MGDKGCVMRGGGDRGWEVWDGGWGNEDGGGWRMGDGRGGVFPSFSYRVPGIRQAMTLVLFTYDGSM